MRRSRQAAAIGYPVMLKSTAGGGGIGMQLCHDAATLARNSTPCSARPARASATRGVYLERFVARARHVEVQIFGDGEGGVVALGERDCSLQRRNQKVVEETPAPRLSDDDARAVCMPAPVALGEAVAYESAGTVEFIYDVGARGLLLSRSEHAPAGRASGDRGGVRRRSRRMDDPPGGGRGRAAAQAVADAAAARRSRSGSTPKIRRRGFRPTPGLLTEVRFPDGVRVDGWIETGTEVTPYLRSDAGQDHRAWRDARRRAREAASALARHVVCRHRDQSRLSARDRRHRDVFAAGDVSPRRALRSFAFAPRTIDVARARRADRACRNCRAGSASGTSACRRAGPMDDARFRLANRIVGNAESTAALEMTVNGPDVALQRRRDRRARRRADGGDARRRRGRLLSSRVAVRAGQTLALGASRGRASATYLAVRGGFDAPEYPRLARDVHARRVRRPCDRLAEGRRRAAYRCRAPRPSPSRARHASERPELDPRLARSACVYGPHGAPDFFLDDDIETLFASSYEVHFNSARTGVRLIGPKPRWARTDGGEAGLHPSNIHDNAYAIGSIDFTGDMPIILGPDGPSLGGFVCPAVIARDELWKIGQLKPGDGVRFVAGETATTRRRAAHRAARRRSARPIVGRTTTATMPVVYRRAGDDNLLVEYGPMALDIALRLRVHLLAAGAGSAKLARPRSTSRPASARCRSITTATCCRGTQPGRRARRIEARLAGGRAMRVPSPHRASAAVVERSGRCSLRCGNIRNWCGPMRPGARPTSSSSAASTASRSEDACRDIVFDADYLVLGLGDVYLGAPVATPLDPRHRLVTTKYNPARTWTPENAVGIGGAYMCIYGMEGPGGYQLFGRTIQVWNCWRTTPAFKPGSSLAAALLRPDPLLPGRAPTN